MIVLLYGDLKLLELSAEQMATPQESLATAIPSKLLLLLINDSHMER